ncbi:ECF transporter S component [Marinisporobacter balticus]|uniref:Putative membrane protein n=1 Tax=Marinisporobacter balticus TaxID=2018667 RepID=A0A4R2L7R0_9FIRM|nr:ECF transporter S component [Marinisporobacter balticus]TCO80066.1 putative membrane protein [Marinisporobacter balticus]
MGKMSVRQLTITGLMAALVLVGTMLIQVPTPTKGYIHIGDSMVYISGILLGPVAGGLAAAIGSMFADVFSSYYIYAPATFVIKGLDALIVGYIYGKLVTGNVTTTKKIVSFSVSVLAGASIMVLGYLVYESFLYGFAVAAVGAVGNITQGIGGGILAAPLMIALDKVNLFEKIFKNYR